MPVRKSADIPRPDVDARGPSEGEQELTQQESATGSPWGAVFEEFLEKLRTRGIDYSQVLFEFWQAELQDAGLLAEVVGESGEGASPDMSEAEPAVELGVQAEQAEQTEETIFDASMMALMDFVWKSVVREWLNDVNIGSVAERIGYLQVSEGRLILKGATVEDMKDWLPPGGDKPLVNILGQEYNANAPVTVIIKPQVFKWDNSSGDASDIAVLVPGLTITYQIGEEAEAAETEQASSQSIEFDIYFDKDAKYVQVDTTLTGDLARALEDERRQHVEEIKASMEETFSGLYWAADFWMRGRFLQSLGLMPEDEQVLKEAFEQAVHNKVAPFSLGEKHRTDDPVVKWCFGYNTGNGDDDLKRVLHSLDAWFPEMASNVKELTPTDLGVKIQELLDSGADTKGKRVLARLRYALQQRNPTAISESVMEVTAPYVLKNLGGLLSERLPFEEVPLELAAKVAAHRRFWEGVAYFLLTQAEDLQQKGAPEQGQAAAGAEAQEQKRSVVPPAITNIFTHWLTEFEEAQGDREKEESIARMADLELSRAAELGLRARQILQDVRKQIKALEAEQGALSDIDRLKIVRNSTWANLTQRRVQLGEVLGEFVLVALDIARDLHAHGKWEKGEHLSTAAKFHTVVMGSFFYHMVVEEVEEVFNDYKGDRVVGSTFFGELGTLVQGALLNILEKLGVMPPAKPDYAYVLLGAGRLLGQESGEEQLAMFDERYSEDIHEVVRKRIKAFFEVTQQEILNALDADALDAKENGTPGPTRRLVSWLRVIGSRIGFFKTPRRELAELVEGSLLALENLRRMEGVIEISELQNLPLALAGEGSVDENVVSQLQELVWELFIAARNTPSYKKQQQLLRFADAIFAWVETNTSFMVATFTDSTTDDAKSTEAEGKQVKANITDRKRRDQQVDGAGAQNEGAGYIDHLTPCHLLFLFMMRFMLGANDVDESSSVNGKALSFEDPVYVVKQPGEKGETGNAKEPRCLVNLPFVGDLGARAGAGRVRLAPPRTLSNAQGDGEGLTVSNLAEQIVGPILRLVQGR